MNVYRAFIDGEQATVNAWRSSKTLQAMEGLVMEFNELSIDVQNRVLVEFAESEASQFNNDARDLISDIDGIFSRLGVYTRGIRYDTNRGYFVFSGTYSYSIEGKGIQKYCSDPELLEIRDRLELLQSRNDYEITADITAGRTMVEVTAYDGDGLYASDFGDEIEEIINDLCQWWLRFIEKQFEHRTSREYLVETIEANGCEFDEDGRIL